MITNCSKNRFNSSKRTICTKLFFLVFFSLFLISNKDTFAQPITPQVIINEVLANPVNENTQEFVELYNNGSTPVDINLFSITDPVDTNDYIVDYTDEFDFGLEGTIIPPLGYAIIVDPNYDGYLNEILEHEADKTNIIMVTNGQDSSLGNGLGNTKDWVRVGEDVFSWDSDSGEEVSWEVVNPESFEKQIGINKNKRFTPGYKNSYLEIQILTRVSENAPWEYSYEYFKDSTINFRAEYYKPVHKYIWTFPNGDIKNGEETNYTFTNYGEFEIELALIDIDNNVLDQTVQNISIIPQIRINEFLPNPENDWNKNGVLAENDDEWIEFYNPSSVDFLMQGWLICDLTTCTVLEENQILSKSFLTLFSYDLGVNLNNESERIILKSSSGLVSDEVSYTNSITDQSYSRARDGGGEWTNDYEVTLNSSNVPKQKIEYSKDIIISEIYASPNTGENEWIELYNSGEVSVDLTNWKIEDSSGKQELSSLHILAKSYLVLEGQALKISLKNSGESIMLKNPDGENIDTFIYNETPKGISSIKIWSETYYKDDVAQTKDPTKGKINVLVDPNDLFYNLIKISIEEVKKNDLNSAVFTQGVISVDIKILGSQIFYIQDSNSGIQIYISDESFFEGLNVGDEIQLFGTLQESNDEYKIKIDKKESIKLISPGNKVIPFIIQTGEDMEAYEGRLVALTGEIVQTEGDTFYLDDGSGKVKINIKDTTGIEGVHKKKGQFAGVIGIVSQYGFLDDGSPNFRILPFEASHIIISDIPINTNDLLANTGNRILLFILISITLLLFEAAVLIKRHFKFFY